MTVLQGQAALGIREERIRVKIIGLTELQTPSVHRTGHTNHNIRQKKQQKNMKNVNYKQINFNKKTHLNTFLNREITLVG